LKYNVHLTQAAFNDLQAINDYYLMQVNDRVTQQILNDIKTTIGNLAHFPERGSVPTELSITNTTRYRQVITSVYRIIYRIDKQDVYVLMVIDGRRDVLTALMRRQLV